jgi:hypothetical protein
LIYAKQSLVFEESLIANSPFPKRIASLSL